MTTRIRFGIMLVVAAALVAGGIWLVREVSIDKCLDRSGAWDYKQGYCVVAAQRSRHRQNAAMTGRSPVFEQGLVHEVKQPYRASRP